jgi:hypothetical protein
VGSVGGSLLAHAGASPQSPSLWRKSFVLSSASDAEFDAVIGCLEDIIMDDKFQLLQRNFMDRCYWEFEDRREQTHLQVHFQ